MAKKLLFAIDIGTAAHKMAEAAGYVGDTGVPFHKSSSSLLANPDGRGYSSFLEKDLFICCWEWLRARHHIWSKAILIGIEQQHSKHFHNPTERQCLLAANCFLTILRTLHLQGQGPPVVSLTTWREDAGVKVKGDKKETMPSKQYNQNKDTSKAVFLRDNPGAKDEIAKVSYGKDPEDVIEACLMVKAMDANLETLLSLPLRHHNVRLQFIGQNVPGEDRKVPLLRMGTPFPNRVPEEHLASLYDAYKATLNAKTKARKSAKFAKTASDVLLRFLGTDKPVSKKRKRAVSEDDKIEIVSD